jgi:hypothetical protein
MTLLDLILGFKIPRNIILFNNNLSMYSIAILCYFFLGLTCILVPPLNAIPISGYKELVKDYWASNKIIDKTLGVLGLIILILLIVLVAIFFPPLLIFRLIKYRKDQRGKISTTKKLDSITGILIAEKDYTNYGKKLEAVREYKYNNLNRIIEIMHFDEDMNLVRVSKNNYDRRGYLAAISNYYHGERLESIEVHDSEKKKIKTWTTSSLFEHEYNSKGEKISTSHYSLTGEHNLEKILKEIIEKL